MNSIKINHEQPTVVPPPTPVQTPKCSYDFISITTQIDEFLSGIDDTTRNLPQLPIPATKHLIAFVEKELFRCFDSGPSPVAIDNDNDLLKAIRQIFTLIDVLQVLPSDSSHANIISHTASVFHLAMVSIEEGFRSMLEYNDDPFKEVDRLERIASTVISVGYETECCQVFIIARVDRIWEVLEELGFVKIAIEDLHKMTWEVLENEIKIWIAAFKHAVSESFSQEKKLCKAVFSSYPAISAVLFSDLARGIILNLVNFGEAVASTSRSGEKLFKFLDMYETMRDLMPAVNDLFKDESSSSSTSSSTAKLQSELLFEMSIAKSRIGEAVVGMFNDVANSIKNDNDKVPVPGGAVHPLTRYIMNYLKYACEYKNTLEQVFQQHNRSDTVNDLQQKVSFADELVKMMGLLDEKLMARSKLYKDPSLTSIFLMNNGRYIVQKIKGLAETREMLGEQWCRKRSSDVRKYHKNYQRETWGKVLNCFKDEGLQIKGGSSVSKTVLKERFKTFNAMFEETHKTQGCWVISDAQLQSELRVSLQAVVVPAYRSFLGRFRRYLDAGRQSDKYIKYAPEDLETCIDELFSGNQSSTIIKGRK
ncbi:exocyst subunit exo70 family protein C1 [Zostera marina]|uniref:Exocyst subunit Exo70 family protein n=1 Tax=Zostera marina TaxID=29655 RepID=A0A0K9NJD6_ZOSMR|nr:exocyst subunit exo70 family protein C1 [Zostera marina]